MIESGGESELKGIQSTPCEILESDSEIFESGGKKYTVKLGKPLPLRYLDREVYYIPSDRANIDASPNDKFWKHGPKTVSKTTTSNKEKNPAPTSSTSSSQAVSKRAHQLVIKSEEDDMSDGDTTCGWGNKYRTIPMFWHSNGVYGLDGFLTAPAVFLCRDRIGEFFACAIRRLKDSEYLFHKRVQACHRPPFAPTLYHYCMRLSSPEERATRFVALSDYDFGQEIMARNFLKPGVLGANCTDREYCDDIPLWPKQSKFYRCADAYTRAL